MKIRDTIIGFLFIVALATALAFSIDDEALTEAHPSPAPEEESNVALAAKGSTENALTTVTKVVDGDTIDVNVNGKIERVRLIGVNTPETVDPRKTVECFGLEASNYTKLLLEGKQVALLADPTQGDRDKYGRLLRYVLLPGGTNANLLIIKGGYAYEYTYDIPYRYQVEFKNAEKFARDGRIGLWGDKCQGKETSALGTSNSLGTTTAGRGGCTIKGNISTKGEKIFHTLGCGSYDQTVISPSQGERWFCTEDEARAAGWRKATNCN